jgi:hypothetical protein
LIGKKTWDGAIGLQVGNLIRSLAIVYPRSSIARRGSGMSVEVLKSIQKSSKSSAGFPSRLDTSNKVTQLKGRRGKYESVRRVNLRCPMMMMA